MKAENRKTVFLTGASGNMGREGLKQLLERRNRFNITILILPTKKEKKFIEPYRHIKELKIIYGDLTNYQDVLKCVRGSDFILHVGGMVSPTADYFPELTTKVNISAAKNIVKAIKAQSNSNQIKLVYIGTVAQTGDRNPPVHWGRTGDPIKISTYDNYALSKIISEREIIDSGLNYWVSLRQTGMLYPELLGKLDPIMFHEPINGVFEWITAEDSGRLLANVCEPDVPEEFWCRIYNIGGGEKYRTMNWEFMQMTIKLIGVHDFRKVWESNWFATQNFHGQWFIDSDVLENYLHFRSGSISGFVEEMKSRVSWITRMVAFLPAWIIKKFIFKKVAEKPLGTLYWINNNDRERIAAYFGSFKEWRNLPHWNEYKLINASKTPKKLDHGYNENKPLPELTIEDMRQVAKFRGGECLSESMIIGDMKTKLKWKCAYGDKFEASPNLIILGGHWCPECVQLTWNYEEEIKFNRFLAQVYSFNFNK